MKRLVCGLEEGGDGHRLENRRENESKEPKDKLSLLKRIAGECGQVAGSNECLILTLYLFIGLKY